MHMTTLIKNRQVVADSWILLKPDADGVLPGIPARGDIIAPLALWQTRRDNLIARPGRLGVWLNSHEGPEAIADDLGHFVLIAVNFPAFGDGRGYSTARLLRERHAYKGELRAIGEVVRDHLYFMANCGFDTFALREDQDVVESLSAFDDFTEAYQTSVIRPIPLFRRRTGT
jgi:uncharacterized protein (DUF934 family)